MKCRLAIALLLGIGTVRPAHAAPATLTVALAIGPAATTRELTRDISETLRASKRLNLLPSVTFQDLELGPIEAVARLRKLTKADLVLAAVNRAGPQAGVTDLVTRLYDLRLGDATRPLRHRLTPDGLKVVARQLLVTIRNRYPLRAEVIGLDDNQVLLDIGSEDGVATGDAFILAPSAKVGQMSSTRLTIARTEAWYSWATRATGSLPVVSASLRPRPWFNPDGRLQTPAILWASPGDPVTEDIRMPWLNASPSTPVATP